MDEKLTRAVVVPVVNFEDYRQALETGATPPTQWWFVYHPSRFLIKFATESRAEQEAEKINAVRRILEGSNE